MCLAKRKTADLEWSLNKTIRIMFEEASVDPVTESDSVLIPRIHTSCHIQPTTQGKLSKKRLKIKEV